MTFNGSFAGGSINGGSGNDSLVFNTAVLGGTSISGGAGADTISGSGITIGASDVSFGVEQVMTPSTSPPLLAVLELLTSGTAHPN